LIEAVAATRALTARLFFVAAGLSGGALEPLPQPAERKARPTTSARLAVAQPSLAGVRTGKN
jgi:hypothetical protein